MTRHVTWPASLWLLALLMVPAVVQAAPEPAGGEQEAPAAPPPQPPPQQPQSSKRKTRAKPRTLEQLVATTPEADEPPSMLQKEAASADVPPCQSDPSELQILLALRERRLELDGRERTVQARETEFKQSQRKLDDRVEQLNQSVARLEARLELGEPGRQARETRLKTLVDGLSTLSAKKAAPILAETEPGLVAELMQRLGATRTAALLAVMPTVKAARIVNITGGPRQPGTRNAPRAAAATPPATQPAKATAAPPPASAAEQTPSGRAAAPSPSASSPGQASNPAEPDAKP